MIPFEPQNVQLARGAIEMAIQRLAGEYPFHARTLERFDVRCQADVGTMGVTVVGDDVRLLYNAEFVIGISLDELVGVLLHEVHHVVFKHVLAAPADFPDRWARVIAEEVTVNEFVKEPLPGQPVRLDSFPNLPPLESTDQRYARLKRERRRAEISLLSDLQSGTEGPGGAGSPRKADPESKKQAGSATPGQAGSSPQRKPGASSGQAAAQARNQAHSGSSRRPKGRGPGEPCSLGTVVDDHSVWQSAREDPKRAAAVLRAVVQDAANEVGHDRVPEFIRQALQDMGIGDSPGGGESVLQGGAKPQLHWTRLLRRFVGQRLAIRPDFTRPARRFPELVGIVPGRRRRASRPKIMAVIDTSGSITDDLLELINAELGRIARDHDVTVVECDAEIQRVYPYECIHSVQGRGGTDLRPPFEPAFLSQHHPDLVVYFTDGYGPAPAKPPRMPVVWCIMPNGERPEKWGRMIQMSPPGGQE